MSIIDDIRALWETSPELFVAAVLGCLFIWFVIWKATRTNPVVEEEPAPKRRRKKKKRKKKPVKPPVDATRQRRAPTQTYECADCDAVLGPDDSYRCTACGDDFCADCGDIHMTEQCM